MGRSTRSNEEVASSRQGSPRRYQLILLNDESKTAEVETKRELGLGDDVDVRGNRYEVIGLAWKKSGEHLLCRRHPEWAADEPTAKEKEWRSAN